MGRDGARNAEDVRLQQVEGAYHWWLAATPEAYTSQQLLVQLLCSLTRDDRAPA